MLVLLIIVTVTACSTSISLRRPYSSSFGLGRKSDSSASAVSSYGGKLSLRSPSSKGSLNMASGPHSEYDAVIIGSGLGGLTAGALLAHNGKKVLVCESHDVEGGCCHT